MKVLTKEELEILLKVETSVEFANQIIKRNQGLLDFLNTLPATKEEIDEWDDDCSFRHVEHFGCPHCHYEKGVFECEKCVWQKANPVSLEKFFCCAITFGGITHEFITSFEYVYLSYSADKEKIIGTVPDDELEYDDYFQELEDCKTFVKGHIEWAKEVIKRAKKNE